MKAIVIGSGIGGLASALRLRKLGYDVLVLEKNETIGGRVGYIKKDGYYFDTGPTLLLMLKPLKELFNELNEKIEDYLDLKLIDPLYRIYYQDGKRLEPSLNLSYYISQISKKDFSNLLRFYSDITSMYIDTIDNFVERNFYSVFDFINIKNIRALLRHKMLSNLYKRVKSYFDDYRLVYANSFQSMYLGISPFSAPFVYTVINYMETVEGIYFPMGGMYKLVEALEKMCNKLGVKILKEIEVNEIDEKNKVVYTNRDSFNANVIVLNADLPYARRELLKKNTDNYEYSCSTIMLYILYEGKTNMLHHNVFFAKDYKLSFDEIFRYGKVPNEPSFYVNISSKTDNSLSPKNSENIYILIPVPNLKISKEDISKKLKEIINKVLDRLEIETDFKRERIREMIYRLPENWKILYNLDYGSAFGLSHKFLQSAYFRPKNYETKGIYYVGASTIPGSGIPMVLISSKLLLERVKRDFYEISY
ncbi:MAG: phytoene desaturase family protein [candidate division WOR-3 bacterium]|nr:phytoene desaturase family protein [candidate division WOR-3 bacterium]MCX7947166.1 phytoene desaturase family protein [candidate division WOR-3 bacterium]MDW8150222.1 phytoene desaturase family protein [candidate division WOR-3 bacterium]